jgi:MFS family permease
VFGVGTVAGMVAQGRLLDRFGFRLVLLTASAVRIGSSIGFLVAIREASLWPSAALALLIGMSEPQVSSCLRALWPSLVGPELRPAAAALSSVLFELPVLAGPLLLTVLMITMPAEVIILIAAGLSAAGSCAFVWSVVARRRRPTSSRDAGFWGPLAVAKVRAVLVVACAQGVAVGVFQVASAAAAVDLGVPSRVRTALGAAGASDRAGRCADVERVRSGRGTARCLCLRLRPGGGAHRRTVLH